MIEVSHVSKTFGTFKAVNDISFTIPTGQIVGLLGPNGAGKTTTMRMISGYLGITEGSIKIDGMDITENSVETKKKIGYMCESAPLYNDMITADYLKYIAEIHNQDPAVKVPELCKICGLKEVMHKNIGELSRGYKQRVGLAHALMHDPEILILDEPTSGLDPNQIEEVRSLIKEIGKTRTVIISTHILGEVEMICSRVIIISQGQVVADSPTELLMTNAGKSVNIGVTVSGATFTEFKKSVSAIEGVEAVTKSEAEKIPDVKKLCSALISVSGGKEIRGELFNLIVKNKWTLYSMQLQKNSLEEVFHSLTKNTEK